MELAHATVAVTGASGMLGAYLCRALRSSGARVVGVVRNPDKARFLAAEGVALRLADLGDRVALTQAFQGCDAVVSNAALYAVRNFRWDDNFRANKEGTENVYHAVAAAGVRRVVQIGTYGVYRWAPGRRCHEDSAQIDGERRQGGAYRATKQLSERLAWELARTHGLNLTVLRPTGIYGSRDGNLMPTVYRVLRLPLAPVPTLTFPLVYAGDVAQAAARALAVDASAGRAYNTGGSDDNALTFVRAVRDAVGSRTRLLPIPVPIHFLCDNSRAATELGFANRPFAAGLAEVVASDRALGLLT